MTLTDTEYWKWRHSISELNKVKAELKLADIECALMQKDIEIKAQRIQLHKLTRVKSSMDLVDGAEQEYKSIKAAIETRLGISLNNIMIDDVTLEVREIPTENSIT